MSDVNTEKKCLAGQLRGEFLKKNNLPTRHIGKVCDVSLMCTLFSDTTKDQIIEGEEAPSCRHRTKMYKQCNFRFDTASKAGL